MLSAELVVVTSPKQTKLSGSTLFENGAAQGSTNSADLFDRLC